MPSYGQSAAQRSLPCLGGVLSPCLPTPSSLQVQGPPRLPDSPQDVPAAEAVNLGKNSSLQPRVNNEHALASLLPASSPPGPTSFQHPAPPAVTSNLGLDTERPTIVQGLGAEGQAAPLQPNAPPWHHWPGHKPASPRDAKGPQQTQQEIGLLLGAGVPHVLGSPH